MHGEFPNVFKNHLHNDTLILEVTVDPTKWNNARNYVIRGSTFFGIKKFELTGTYSCKVDAWEGNMDFKKPYGAVDSERGTFTRSFLTFSGKPKLMLNGKGARWYREDATEQGNFEMGKLHRRPGDAPGILVRRLAEWVATKVHGR